MTARRKALKPFTFSNGGPQVPKGGIACISLISSVRSSGRYVDVEEFDGHRFEPGSDRLKVADNSTASDIHKVTEVSEHFPTWGFGSLAWYVLTHLHQPIKTVVVNGILILLVVQADITWSLFISCC